VIPVLAAVRAIHLFSLMALWGGSAYCALLGRSIAIAVPRFKAGVLAAASMALLTGVAWLFLVAGQISGDWREAGSPTAILAVVQGTLFGQVWTARLIGMVFLWLMAWLDARMVLVPLAALVLGSLGLTSHAAAASGGYAAMRALNDGVHLLTAGFWIGGLLVLLELGCLHRREPGALAGPFRVFSRWGLYAVAILLITGTANAASIMGLSGLSPENAYADLLGVKIALALAMIAFAAVNRSQLLPALENGEGGVLARLRHNVTAELVLAVLVVAIVGYLGMISPS
jgi:copper resistance protein D